MKVFAIICHNGLGHYKRCIEILHALLQESPATSITVVCEHWQVERMQGWEVSASFWSNPSVRLLEGIAAPGVHWSLDGDTYGTGILTNWHKRLQGLSSLEEADLVLSDNLPQVLYYRPDAVLIGSFLWSDVLGAAYPENEYVQTFVKDEQQLLQQHRPYMICVDDMVMDNVSRQTRTVRMPWFCTRTKKVHNTRPEKPRIALLGGATSSCGQILLNLSLALADTKQFEIFLPAVDRANHALVSKFDYSEESFLQLDAIICRPGIGTLTDCVRYGIPPITVHEEGNLEMVNNSIKVEELGIGIKLGNELDTLVAFEGIKDFFELGRYREAKKHIENRPDGGVEETVKWILNNFK